MKHFLLQLLINHWGVWMSVLAIVIAAWQNATDDPWG